MKLKDKVTDFIGKWIIILLGLTSIFAFVDGFEIQCNIFVILLVMLLSSGVFLALFQMKHKGIVMIVIGVVFAIVVLMVHRTLISGIYSIANVIIKQYRIYFSANDIALFGISREGVIFSSMKQINTFLLSMLAFVYAYLLVTFTWNRIFAPFHILLSLIFVIPVIVLGLFPNTFLVSILIIYYLMCFMFQHNRTVYPVRMMILSGISAIIIVFIFIFVSPTDYDSSGRYEKINKKIDAIVDKYHLDELSFDSLGSMLKGNAKSEEAMGGVNGGKLGQVDRLEYTNDIIMRATVPEINGNIYLKGYVALNYKKDHWGDIDEEQIATFKNSIGNVKYLDDYGTPYLTQSTGDVKKMTLKYFKSDTDAYRFVPYFAMTGNGLPIEYYYDLRPKAKEGDSFWYSYIEIQQSQYGEYHAGGDASQQESLAYTVAMEVPEDIRSLFDELISDSPQYDGTSDSFNECVDYVKNYLQNHTTYSIAPGRLGKNEDYVTEFLTVKKEGYCTAYASSAVLMFRYMGIPARYVEGYVITPKDCQGVKVDADGYKVVDIRDKYAHAWAEVYIPGIGYAPIETTPGYGGTSGTDNPNPGAEPKETTMQKDSDEPSSTSGEEKTTTENPSESNENTSTPSNVGTDKSGEGRSGKISTLSAKEKKCVTVIIIVIVVILVLSVFVYKWQERRRILYDYKTEDMRHNVIVLGALLKRYLGRIGIDYCMSDTKKELAEELNRRASTARAKKDINVIAESEEETIKVLSIVEKAKYCDENCQITQEEYEKVRQYVEELKNSLQYLKNRV